MFQTKLDRDKFLKQHAHAGLQDCIQRGHLDSVDGWWVFVPSRLDSSLVRCYRCLSQKQIEANNGPMPREVAPSSIEHVQYIPIARARRMVGDRYNKNF